VSAQKKKTGNRTTNGKPPAMAEVVETVFAVAEPLCRAEGMELVYVEFQREASDRILRLYIDKPDGVVLDDCVVVSRQLGDVLDVYLDRLEPYNLEVSSPGSDRPLGKVDDFNRFKGCRAKIRTLNPLGGRKNFTGVLMGFSDGAVKLKIEADTVAIPFENISKARLINFNGEIPCLSQI
jgi:ribosome maturation factor RimP